MSLQRLVGLKIGLLTGIIMVIYGLFTQWTQEQTHQVVNSLIYFVQGIGIAYAYIEFKKRSEGGFMNYKQGLSVGFWLSVMSGIVIGIQYYVQAKFLSSPMIAELIAAQRKALEESNTPKAQIDETMKLLDVVFTPEGLIFMAIFSTVLSGFFLSMMLTSFMQKYPVPEDNN